MFTRRSFLTYSLAMAILWAVALIGVSRVKGADGFHQILLVFGVFSIGWSSTTIARYVYPSPLHWTRSQHHSA